MTIKHLYPTQRPSLDLNFARTKRLDPRVDFERFSVGTYVGNDRLIKTAVDHEPRFDHDPVTGESLGLLVEEARTNLVKNSGNLSGWNPFGAPIRTLNATTAPDGTTTATKFEKSKLDREVIYTTVGTGVQSRSFFAKAGTSSFVFTEGAAIWFDLSNGTVPVNPSGEGSIVALPNGWYRCTVSKTWGAHNFALGISDAINSYNAAAGNYAYFWGAQAEASPYPTSYIPTTTATVTRAADVASLTNTNVYDTDSFTILNDPYGAAGGSSTLSIVGGGQTPVKRTTVYNQELSQSQINTLVKKDDEFWRWRILGSSFALSSFFTDGQVTVDWGDGTIETLTTSEHTFSDGGGYHDVGFRLDSGTYFRPYINDNATHKDKLIALGPAPESMKLNAAYAFRGCSNLKAFDATVDATGGTSFYQAWRDCSSLTSFPLIDTSSGINFNFAWHGCSSLTSFPLIDTSNVTNFSQAWLNCSSLISFPLIDTSSGTIFSYAWQGCSSLTSFPALDTSSATNLVRAWYGCSSLTSFPLLNVNKVTGFGDQFQGAWLGCSSLTDFPAGFFDNWGSDPSWTGVADYCFNKAWDNCSSLTATSVENILNSIDTSGQSAPASGVDITIDYDAGTGTPSVSTAVTNLKSRGWTITLNGVAQ